jgi:hypothetical protein
MTNYNEASLRLTNHDQEFKNVMNSKEQSFSKVVKVWKSESTANF